MTRLRSIESSTGEQCDEAIVGEAELATLTQFGIKRGPAAQYWLGA